MIVSAQHAGTECKEELCLCKEQRGVLELDLRVAAPVLPAASDLGTEHLHPAPSFGRRANAAPYGRSPASLPVSSVILRRPSRNAGSHDESDHSAPCPSDAKKASTHATPKPGATGIRIRLQAELWKSTPSCRLWIRWTLSTMGRGGSAGQQIRDEILVP